MAINNRFGRDKSPNQGQWLYEYDVAAEQGFADSGDGVSAVA